MKRKYLNAISALGEILAENRHDLEWKELQIESKTQEIARLKAKLAEIESYVSKLESTCGKLRQKASSKSIAK